jgi:hypothetical protein
LQSAAAPRRAAPRRAANSITVTPAIIANQARAGDPPSSARLICDPAES